ncbi:uncharacterized protein LY89DRAFT_789131 [Mollisia scopiformis]|uniref:Tat pathway signal sequence n=1 Tax=Mollisia scopiformis TaxID=149040 RepID=A0A132B7D5_MOLSC|nr:uncharacterized protein LY89DRAFT_789131 [Mollisia scopiformis]KUJ08320.1 hypothetical protein LY89DRAFT_789131 [Mollisia scopiformis]
MTSKLSQMMKFRDNSDDDIRYDPLSDEKSLLESSHGEPVYSKQGWRSRTSITYVLTLALLLISVVLNVVVWLQLSKLHEISHAHDGTEYGSPVVRDIGLQYHKQPINGSFEKQTIYRQKPSKEVDDAWLALGVSADSIVIPVDEAAQFGIREGQVKRVIEDGGGYMADVMVFHNLHCLNLIRQTSRWNWDHYSALIGTPEAFGTAFEGFDGEIQLEKHFTHCVDMLRQEIMCDADTNVYGQWYVKNHGPSKDFSINRQCKDFDAILKWYQGNHIDMDNTYVRHTPGDPVLDEEP